MSFSMTKTEVAELFKISTKTVERNSKSGRLPKPIYVGDRSPRWNREAVYAIYNGTVQPGALSASVPPSSS